MKAELTMFTLDCDNPVTSPTRNRVRPWRVLIDPAGHPFCLTDVRKLGLTTNEPPHPVGEAARSIQSRATRCETAQTSSVCCASEPPAGSNPAASAASALRNQTSASVWSNHCEPST